MKHIIISALATCGLLAPSVINADTFTAGDVNYNTLSANTVEVGTNKSLAGDVVIPETVTYNGTTYTVTALGANAFKDNKTMTSLSLPKTINKLGNYCLMTTTKLTSLTLPAAITTIGDGAFNGCGLSTITLPANVSSLGKAVFSYSSKLTTINVDAANQTYTSYDGVLYNKAKTQLLFAGGGITSVNIATTCQTIGQYAFNGCASLTAVSFPPSVKTVGYYAFNLCQKLGQIDLGSVEKLDVSAFDRCYPIVELTIPATMKTISNDAFSDCSKIAKITTLATTVPSLNEGAFNDGIYTSAKLIVPSESYEAYTSAAGWKKFTNVEVAMGEVTEDYSATIIGMGNAERVQLTNPVKLIFKVRNEGRQTITSLTGTLTIDGDTYPAQTISGLNIPTGAVKNVTLPLTLNEAKYQMSLNIDQVNGQPNANPKPKFDFNLETVNVSIPDDAPEATLCDFKSTSSYGYRGVAHLQAATKFVDKNLTGAKVIGVKMLNLPTKGIDNVKLWSSKALNTTPDTEELDVTVDANGEAKVTFLSPITLTDAGAFFGVTLDVTDGSTWWPFAVSTPENSGTGFYLNYGNGLQNYSSYGALEMVFYLEGDIKPDRMQINKCTGIAASMSNKEFSLPFEVVNYGANPVTAIDYSYTINGATKNGSASFDPSLSRYLTQKQAMTIGFEPVPTPGNYNVAVTIDKVNGTANTMALKTITVPVSIGAFKTTHRPMFEEYTGTGCGYCPRGTVGMNEMAKTYPDFIAAVYHNYNDNDPMYIPYSKLPNIFSGSAPSAILDRQTGEIDPYYGSNGDPMGIKADYEAYREIFAPADLGLEANLNADSTITVKGSMNFSYVDDGYSLCYVLTIDGLNHANDSVVGNAWQQGNYYSGSSDDPLINSICNGTYDLNTFNHVVIDCSRASSSNHWAKADLTVGQPYSATNTFNLNNCSLADKSWIKGEDWSKINVIAFLLDDKARIRNAVKVRLGEKIDTPTEIKSVVAGSNGEVQYYDLMGRRIQNPDHGIVIKVQDGRATKVAL